MDHISNELHDFILCLKVLLGPCKLLGQLLLQRGPHCLLWIEKATVRRSVEDMKAFQIVSNCIRLVRRMVVQNKSDPLPVAQLPLNPPQKQLELVWIRTCSYHEEELRHHVATHAIDSDVAQTSCIHSMRDWLIMMLPRLASKLRRLPHVERCLVNEGYALSSEEHWRKLMRELNALLLPVFWPFKTCFLDRLYWLVLDPKPFKCPHHSWSWHVEVKPLLNECASLLNGKESIIVQIRLDVV